LTIQSISINREALYFKLLQGLETPVINTSAAAIACCCSALLSEIVLDAVA